MKRSYVVFAPRAKKGPVSPANPRVGLVNRGPEGYIPTFSSLLPPKSSVCHCLIGFMCGKIPPFPLTLPRKPIEIAPLLRCVPPKRAPKGPKLGPKRPNWGSKRPKTGPKKWPQGQKVDFTIVIHAGKMAFSRFPRGGIAKNRFLRSWDPLLDPKRPKTGPKRPKLGPKRPNWGSRDPIGGSNWGFGGPKRPPIGPKKGPRNPQLPANRAQRAGDLLKSREEFYELGTPVRGN